LFAIRSPFATGVLGRFMGAAFAHEGYT
jgi:hypothetical protein